MWTYTQNAYIHIYRHTDIHKDIYTYLHSGGLSDTSQGAALLADRRTRMCGWRSSANAVGTATNSRAPRSQHNRSSALCERLSPAQATGAARDPMRFLVPCRWASGAKSALGAVGCLARRLWVGLEGRRHVRVLLRLAPVPARLRQCKRNFLSSLDNVIRRRASLPPSSPPKCPHLGSRLLGRPVRWCACICAGGPTNPVVPGRRITRMLSLAEERADRVL